jgi:hypothetical protein
MENNNNDPVQNYLYKRATGTISCTFSVIIGLQNEEISKQNNCLTAIIERNKIAEPWIERNYKDLIMQGELVNNFLILSASGATIGMGGTIMNFLGQNDYGTVTAGNSLALFGSCAGRAGFEFRRNNFKQLAKENNSDFQAIIARAVRNEE